MIGEPNNEFNLVDIIRKINFNRKLSNGAKVVAIQIAMAAGRKGYVRDMTMRQLGWELNIKRTQLHEYVNELLEADWLERQSHPGRPNVWVIKSIRAIVIATSPVERTPRYKISKELTLGSNANFKLEDQTTTTIPVDLPLLRDILTVTGDTKSTKCFIKIIKSVPESIVYGALTSLKIAMNEGLVSKPGAYFVGTIKKQFPNLFAPKVKEDAPEPDYQQKPYVEPAQEGEIASTEVAMAAIAEIKAKLFRKAS